jgi:hypothetical protein
MCFTVKCILERGHIVLDDGTLLQTLIPVTELRAFERSQIAAY